MTLHRPFSTLSGICILVVSFLAAPAWAQMDPGIPSLSQDQVTQLNSGNIILDVVPGAAPIGDSLGVVNGAPAEVMAIIRDFNSHHEFFGDLAESEITGQDGDATLCRGITDTPWPMDDRNWTIRVESSERNLDGLDILIAEWSYVVDSGNIVNTTGYWLLIPWGADGNQTLLRYRIQVDLGTWLPDFLLTWATEDFLPEKINALRDRIATLQ
jgi:hypothetical protein